MFGHRYWGARYFGPRYWGPALGGAPSVVVEEAARGGGLPVRRRRVVKVREGSPELERQDREREALAQAARAAYEHVMGLAPSADASPAPLAVIVAPFKTASSDAALPPAEIVDWAALVASIERAERFLAAYRAFLAEQDDIETLLLLS